MKGGVKLSKHSPSILTQQPTLSPGRFLSQPPHLIPASAPSQWLQLRTVLCQLWAFAPISPISRLTSQGLSTSPAPRFSPHCASLPVIFLFPIANSCICCLVAVTWRQHRTTARVFDRSLLIAMPLRALWHR